MDHEAYIRFLVQHQAELNLPYPLAHKLSFFSSPLLFGQGMLILTEDTYELAGAAGFVYGTGSNEYKDREVCQVEVAYLLPAYRGTLLFGIGLARLLQLIREGEPAVERIQFWTPSGSAELRKLFAKLLALPGASAQEAGNLTGYQVPFGELEAYIRRFQPSAIIE